MKILFFCIFLFIACSINRKEDMKKWKVIQTMELKKTNEDFASFLFINNNDGFLFGTNYTDDILLNKKFNEFNAVVYKTADGGFSWVGKTICKGRFISSFNINDSIFCLAVNSSDEAYGDINKSMLFASYNSGADWFLMSEFPFFVKNIFFESATRGIAIGRNVKENENSWQILQTLDGGKNWKEIFQIQGVVEPVLFKNTLWSISTGISGQNSLLNFNLNNLSLATEHIPVGFKLQKLFLTGGGLYLAGVIDSKMVLFKRNAEHEFNKVREFQDENLFPEHLFVYDRTVTVVAGKMKKLSVDYVVFRSLDDGKTWIESKLPIPDYFNPVAFYNDRIWGYAGEGKIQMNNH